MDPSELIERLQKGDDTAGPVLVSLVAPDLLGYADIIGSDLPQIDRELAVETALGTAVRRIDRYDSGRGSFKAWARTFVRHAIQDWRREHPRGADEPLPVIEHPTTPTDEETLEASDKSVALTALVLTESEQNQMLLKLRFDEQFTHAQIAEQLEISESTARKRLERILTRLHERARDEPELRHLTGDAQ